MLCIGANKCISDIINCRIRNRCRLICFNLVLHITAINFHKIIKIKTYIIRNIFITIFSYLSKKNSFLQKQFIILLIKPC